jgi:hypothetical protein
VKCLSGDPLLGGLLTSPINIRIGWKDLPGTNTLAYYKNPEIVAVKSCIVQALDDSRGVVYDCNIFKLQPT